MSNVTAASVTQPPRVYGDILLLTLCQAMLMTGTSLVLASSAIIGGQLAIHPALATVPLSLQYVTTMLVMIPVSRAMQRWGRRPIFVSGALVGAVGMMLATWGIWSGSFLLFAAAGMLIGMHNAVGQFYRFAAADAVTADRKSRAISLTLTGGVLAAFIGPNLATATRDAIMPPFTASFLALTATTLAAAGLASLLRRPAAAQAAAADTSEARPLGDIVRQPVFLVAVLTAMIAYATMNLLMVATPLAMQCLQHGFGDIALVIQWHVVAMFAPSFVTGDLIRRFGVLRIISAGALLVTACIGIGLTGDTVPYFQAGLILLGIGWNFLYVGATTLLTEAYRPAEQGRVQGLNDTLVFAAVTLSSLSSAGLQDSLGWRALNGATLIGPLVVLAAVLWLAGVRRKPGSRRQGPSATPMGTDFSG